MSSCGARRGTPDARSWTSKASRCSPPTSSNAAFRPRFRKGADQEDLGSPVVVVRVNPATLKLPPERAGWAPEGILAYSKICTHAACAISLFRDPLSPSTESRGPALVCPCHYSTFDVLDGGSVEFGPAGRPLPQLPLADRRCWRAARRRADVRAGRPVLVGRLEVSSSGRDRRSVDAVAFVDERLGAARGMRWLMDYVFPDHWSFLLGEIALYSFIVLILTGTFLALFFDPDTTQAVYHGSYQALQGQSVSDCLRLDAAPFVQRVGWPARPPDSPLGGAGVRRGDHAPFAADRFHWRVSQAPRRQLLHRRDAVGARDPRGVRGLLATRRSALGDGPGDRVGGRDVTAADRRPVRHGAVGRALPGVDGVRVAAVHRARVHHPGDPRRR